MSTLRKIIVFLLILFVSIVTVDIKVMATDTQGEESDIQVSFIVDEEAHTEDGETSLVLTIKNISNTTIKNVALTDITLTGFEFLDSELENSILKLQPGESRDVTVMFRAVEEDVDENILETVGNKNTSNTDNILETVGNKNTLNTDNIPEIVSNENILNSENVLAVDAGDNSNSVLYIVMLLVTVMIVLWLGINEKKQKRLIALILSVVLLTGSISLIMDNPAYATIGQHKEVIMSSLIYIDNTNVEVNVTVKYETINIENTVKVTYELVLDDSMINELEKYETIYLEKGEVLNRPNNPSSDMAFFIDWHNTLDADEGFDFSKPIVEDVSLYANWELDLTDTDGDGFQDFLEKQNGTDLNNQDTDYDGLSDYIEFYLGLDPLARDTDNNGVSDCDEDADGDLLTNGQEVAYGTDTKREDSDYDGLPDCEEIKDYETNPLREDTDGDGALDSWEIQNEYDPCVEQDKFEVQVESEKVTEYNLVSAMAQMLLNGNQIETLNVKAVSMSDNFLVRATLPGYMGYAYDFTVDGEFDKAILTFEYNTDVYGEPDEEFQPRIYYVNEETQLYEELENQLVENGKVTAETTHFSTYIMLNKVEFDKVWDSDIRPTDMEDVDSNVSLDVAFVIDYSLSMYDNDPNQLFKDVTKSFLSKLRIGQDKASAIKFVRRATVISELSSDIESVKKAIDGIVYNDGYTNYPGTDGSLGIKKGLDTLSESTAKYKYIVFLTDGEDNQYSYAYDDLIEQANIENVKIYTVGLGSASESVLKKVAEGTGGKYYKAQTANAVMLEECFGIIEMDTIDRFKDSNKDGITDYYTKLIYEGIMPGAE